MRLRVGSGLPNIQQKSLQKIKLQYTTIPNEQQKNRCLPFFHR